MMKKMTSMLLALTLCLTLSVPAFAAEEEPEPAAEPAVQTEAETVAQEEVAAPADTEAEPATEPAVQTEVETAPEEEAAAPAETELDSVNEPAAQAEAGHTHVYYESDYIGVDPDNYTSSGHAYINKGSLYKCSCGDSYIVAEAYYYQSHSMRVSVYGTAIGDNGETVPTYLHYCAQCNYNYINLSKIS